MRAIYHIGDRDADIGRLSSRFPQIAFVTTRSKAEILQQLPSAEALIINGGHYSPTVSAAAHASPSLKWIQLTTSGIDGPLRSGGFPAHVCVSNVAGLRADNLSEHAFALLLFLARRLRMAEDARETRVWARDAILPHCVSLKGKTIVVVGLGAIGQAVARKAKGFEMRVVGVSRAYCPDAIIDTVFPRAEATAAFREADAIVIAAPSEDETRGLISAAALAIMNPSVIIVNVSRGDVIDEAALAEACRSGRIGGAGIDVTTAEPLAADSPFWSLDNVIVTPHVGGAGSDQLAQLLDMVGDNVARYCKGEPLAHLVRNDTQLAELSWPGARCAL